MKETILTRREAHEYVKPLKTTRCSDILEVMGKDSLTAREIAERLGYADMNKVRPRLSEMTQEGVIRVVGTKTCHSSNRKVVVYRVVM